MINGSFWNNLFVLLGYVNGHCSVKHVILISIIHWNWNYHHILFGWQKECFMFKLSSWTGIMFFQFHFRQLSWFVDIWYIKHGYFESLLSTIAISLTTESNNSVIIERMQVPGKTRNFEFSQNLWFLVILKTYSKEWINLSKSYQIQSLFHVPGWENSFSRSNVFQFSIWF